MRILISGGGTGGHINPAVAIANYLREKNKNIQVAFAGTQKGLESKVVPKEGYKLYCLKVRPFNRKKKFSFANIDALIKAFTSQLAAKKIIKKYNPDIVIGTGGYVSWPVLSAAAKLKIPTVIHEQNAFPGLTTKMLAKTADKVMISFEESRKYFKDKSRLIYTGNPVKAEYFNINP
ncbi:MAG: glycosyltransferase, partial [Oscillospiraceae bacterium]|nr:glycosyltransferase [Oscillospiraceae bacterium]